MDYAENPDKTTPREYLDEDLYSAIRYAENDDKTDKQLFVGGINCSKQNAYAEMMAVQRRFGMKGKVVAYHGIQSFRTNEVTPEQAFEIGKETARRMWADKYQVLVTVHLNTDQLHCHFVLNPCSFIDGQKFKNKIGDHLELRKVSDAVCREHGLSVLENSDFYTRGKKKEYWAHKNGQMTHRDMVKRDVEYVLQFCDCVDDVYARLKSIGYTLSDNEEGKHLTIIAPGWQRPIRMSSLGFTTEYLNMRIDENYRDNYFFEVKYNNPIYKPKSFPLEWEARRLEFTIEHSHAIATIAVDLLFLIVIRVLEMSNELLLSAELRHEVRNVKQFISEHHFLEAENIHTMNDLEHFIGKTEKDISKLEHQRQLIDNKKRRAKTPEEVKRYKNERKEVTSRITPLRKKLKRAKEIYEKSPRLFELVKLELNLERQVRDRDKQITK